MFVPIDVYFWEMDKEFSFNHCFFIEIKKSTYSSTYKKIFPKNPVDFDDELL